MNTVTLGDICEVTAGQSAPQDSDAFGTAGKPFIRAGSLGDLVLGGTEESCEMIPDDIAKRLRMRLFPEDTILFAKSGMSATLGRVYRLRKPAYVVSHLATVIPGNRVEPSYLQRWFERNPPSRLIPNEAYPSIRTSEIATLKIDLPCLAEQKRIAAILDKADAIRRKRQQAIKLADEFLRSVFLEMFGDSINNTKRWPLENLGKHIKFMTSGSRGWASYYADAGAKFLRIQNIGYNSIIMEDIAFVNPPDTAEARRTQVQQGDVLVSITADLGRSAVIPPNFGQAYINQHLALLRVSDFDPIYLSAFFSSKGGRIQFDRLNRGGVKSGLNFDDLRGLSIPMPPISIQNKYSSIYYKLSDLKSTKIYNQNGNSEMLFKSLSNLLFRGQYK